MDGDPDDAPPIRFGRFEIQPGERRLLVDGVGANLGSRAFDLLLALASRPGKLLTKDALLDLVWPHLVVEENNLQVQISTLRKLLGPEVITTVPGRGYRFIAPLVDAVAAGAAAVTASPAPAPQAAPVLLKTNLPARLPALIGREEDLAALQALLLAQPLVTVVGTGGIGKTLLAQHVLHGEHGRHAHGVCFVELAGVREPAQVAGAVSAALGVQAGGADALLALVQAVAPLELLIALDNAEHLIDEVARVAAALHAGAPRVALLVTSQAPLQLGVEHVYRIGTLALPDDTAGLAPAAALGFGAVALFAERVRQVDRRFTLDDGNVATVAALCRRLDGLPLAIGLAAARAPLLGVEGLAAALGERLKLLTGGGRDASERHRTLRAALEWSHGLLDDREQRLFRRLGVVVGSASLDLVRRIAVDETLDEWSALDALSVLVDRSLVMLEGGGSDAMPRYRLLESPRAYAIERLEAAGEAEPLRRRHAHAIAGHFEQAYETYLSGRYGYWAWRDDLELDRDNARAAFAWSARHDPASAVAITPGLSILLAVDRSANMALFQAVEPLLTEHVPAGLRIRVLCEAAIRLPVRRAVEWATRAPALGGESDDARGRLLALAALAWDHGLAGQAEAAAKAVAGMEDVAASLPPLHGEVAQRCESGRAAAAIAEARWTDAAQHFRRCAAISLAARGREGQVENIIEAEQLAGRIDEALREGEAALARLQGTREQYRVVRLRVQLIAASLALDDAGRARAHARETWPQIELVMTPASLADHSALLAALESRPRAAARLIGYADAFRAAQGDPRIGVEARSAERAIGRLRELLDEAEFQRLKAEGAAFDVEAAARQALAESDHPG